MKEFPNNMVKSVRAGFFRHFVGKIRDGLVRNEQGQDFYKIEGVSDTGERFPLTSEEPYKRGAGSSERRAMRAEVIRLLRGVNFDPTPESEPSLKLRYEDQPAGASVRRG